MLIIKDLSSTTELDRKALAEVTGGFYSSYARRIILGGAIPFNKDLNTGGELAREYDRFLRGGMFGSRRRRY